MAIKELMVVAIACLALASCRNHADPAPPVAEISAPQQASEPGLDVATLIAFPDPGPDDPKETGEAAWTHYREAMLSLESEFGVATVLEARVLSIVGDCGDGSWDRLLIQRYAGVSSLAEVIRSPQRSQALEWWDSAVGDFHRVLGTPERDAAPAANAESVDRVLLIDSEESDTIRQIRSAELDLLARQGGEEWLELSLDADLNEVDAQWDVFSITRYPDRESLVEVLDAEPLQEIRQRRIASSLKVCELLVLPGSSGL